MGRETTDSSQESASQILTLSEYKIFLRDQVRRSVLRWLAGIFGAVGIAGIVTILAFGHQIVGIQLEDKLKPVADGLEVRQEVRMRLMTEPLQRLIADLRNNIETAVRAEVSQTLLVRTGLYKELLDKAGEIVKTKESEIETKASQAVHQAVTKEVTPAKVRQTVAESVEAEITRIGFDRVMVERLRPVLDGRQAATHGQKEQALRLLSVFSADDHQLRELLIRYISNANEPKPLRLVAVQTYRPSADRTQDIRALNATLAIVEAESWTPTEMEDLTRFATAFAAAHSGDMLTIAQRTNDGDVRTVITQALGRSNSDEAALALLRLAETPNAPSRSTDTTAAAVRLMAWRGLAAMQPDRVWKNDTLRTSALTRAWDLLPEVVSDNQAIEGRQRALDRAEQVVRSPSGPPTAARPEFGRQIESPPDVLQRRLDDFRDEIRRREGHRQLGGTPRRNRRSSQPAP
jgi:hypothetical protein